MTSVTLHPITSANFQVAVRLKVADDQINLVAPNVMSIAQAYVEPSLEPLAVYDGDTMVGFAMPGRDPQSGIDWIVRLMIDQQYQGRGYGRAAMHALIDYLRCKPAFSSIKISFVPANRTADRLYRSLGFVDEGEVDEGETVLHLKE